MVYDIVDFKALHEAQKEDLLEMAEWKDEQHAEEKRQWIEKACEWIANNAGAYQNDNRKYGEGCDYDTESLLEDFREAMKGE